DSLVVRGELPRDLEGERACDTPAGEYVRPGWMNPANQLDVLRRDFLERPGKCFVFRGRVENLQRGDRLLASEPLGQQVEHAGIVDRDQGNIGAVRLQFHHLAEIEFTRVAVQQAGQPANARGTEQGGQRDAT